MRLEIVDEAEQKHVKSFTKNRVLIGRSKEADFCIEGAGISRQHLIIEYASGKYFAEDLGSSNGVYVNEEKMSPKSKMEIQTFFPLRIGSKTTISILSEEDESQSLGALNQKVDNEFFGEKTSTVKRQLRENKTTTISSSKLKEKPAKKSSPITLFLTLLIFGGGGYYLYKEFFQAESESGAEQTQVMTETNKAKTEPSIYKNLSFDQINDLKKLQQIQEKEFCKSGFEKNLCTKYDLKTDLGEGVFTENRTVYIFGELVKTSLKNSGVDTKYFKDKANEVLLANEALKLMNSFEFKQEKIEQLVFIDLGHGKDDKDYILSELRTNKNFILNADEKIINEYARKASEATSFDEFYSANSLLYLYRSFADKSEIP